VAKIGFVGSIGEFNTEGEELTDEALDAFKELPDVFLKAHMEEG
jgi:hypothetical protein